MSKNTLKDLEEQNRKLACKFESIGVTMLKLISFGNSISSGYSMVRTIKPILYRNNTLPSILKEHGIDLTTNHFARAQSNGDEHLLEWILNNIKQSQINQLNRHDYSGSPTSLQSPGITKEEVEEYFPLNMEDDIGLLDALQAQGTNLANILIYNGCTGSLIDNLTRDGKKTQQLFYGVNRDILGLEAILKFIQNLNRTGKGNVQVYICGVPNFLGLNLSEIVNLRLKKIATNYANTVYVHPVKNIVFNHPIYISPSTDATFIQRELSKLFVRPDIHYNEVEYLKALNHIMQAITDNYSITKGMIAVDREAYQFNNQLETEESFDVREGDYASTRLEAIIKSALSTINQDNERNLFLKRVLSYLINKTPYDFWCINKRIMTNTIRKAK
ncbi:MAG: hypothetical protein PHD02_00810 [Bacilli bacterium]|nr:hypothetical protein [Bacilli bacterium]